MGLRRRRRNTGKGSSKLCRSLSDRDAALEQDGAQLIDQSRALADKSRTPPVQRLQVELRLALRLDEAHGRPRFQPTIADVRAIDPDRKRGGRCLVLPPGYKGHLPNGHYTFEPLSGGQPVFQVAHFEVTLVSPLPISGPLGVYRWVGQ